MMPAEWGIDLQGENDEMHPMSGNDDHRKNLHPRRRDGHVAVRLLRGSGRCDGDLQPGTKQRPPSAAYRKREQQEKSSGR